MDLSAYLQRIGFVGDARPDLLTLRQIHRRHLAAIPYENLDVQLARKVGFDVPAIYRKLVTARRGGWCYEMNGLFAWALEQIGFRVTRLAGAVMRAKDGDSSIGSHLALCVHLDEGYLADVGFGDGLIEPAAIREGSFRQDAFDFRFERVDDAWWRFHNQPHGGAPSFDFQLSEAPQERLSVRCEWLQSALESPFVQNAVCQRYVDGRLIAMRGRAFKSVRGTAVEKCTIDTLDEYERVLREEFDIELPEATLLWQKVSVRHETWLREQENARSFRNLFASASFKPVL
jgi:N-hydroxyarylamine O-acetyltransferase